MGVGRCPSAAGAVIALHPDPTFLDILHSDP
jgi:hypothetical protein